MNHASAGATWIVDRNGSGAVLRRGACPGLDPGCPALGCGRALATGLRFARNRDYNQGTGVRRAIDPQARSHLRLTIQPDRIRWNGGANLYAYVGNDPMNATDPWGAKTCTGSRLERPEDYDCSAGSANVSCADKRMQHA
ncbi:RHS repeat-associated core domain-containing protein [Marinicauda salina]|uniref:hypothetical protein n=1 Tax=Marinicauda salina TaxID=2135793 RepID=UPI0011B25918|nr:hypothetical protein [Marinicauda salina]